MSYDVIISYYRPLGFIIILRVERERGTGGKGAAPSPQAQRLREKLKLDSLFQALKKWRKGKISERTQKQNARELGRARVSLHFFQFALAFFFTVPPLSWSLEQAKAIKQGLLYISLLILK